MVETISVEIHPDKFGRFHILCLKCGKELAVVPSVPMAYQRTGEYSKHVCECEIEYCHYEAIKGRRCGLHINE